MNSQGTRAWDGLAAPWSPWASIRSPVMRNVLGFCAFELAYFAAYHFGMTFSPTLSAPFWFPDSVLLCGLLCTRQKWWWLLLLATLPVRLLVNVPPDLTGWFLGAVYINDCAKAALTALLLRRFLEDPIRLTSLRDLGVYLLFAVTLVPLLSAFGGAAARFGIGRPFWESFEQWFLGDVMAGLIITPILFYWVLRPPNPSTFSLPRFLEAGALIIGLILSLTLAFEPSSVPRDISETRFYAPMPFMVWAAIRFRMFGATGAVALFTIFALNSALRGSGSFADLSYADIATRLQHFLLLRVAPLYLAGVLIEQSARAARSLRESEQRFHIIADQAPMMIWASDIDAGCEFANRSWLEFTGRTLEQNLGTGWAQCLHPDDRPRALDDYMQSFNQRRPVKLEFRGRRADGDFRWIHVTGTPRYGAGGEFLGYIGSAVDITERHEQEAALKRSEARYRDVVENQSNFVCRFLPDGSLTFINSTYCRFQGRARLELLGEDFVELLPAAAHATVREAIEHALGSAEPASWECEVARPDGGRGWQSWVCHAIDSAPDEVRELQVIGYDITDRKRAEESGRQLAHATRFAAVGELTAMVAHEINQPLTAILSNAEAGEIMLRGAEPSLPELREILADIRKEDLRADSAIRSIRSLLQRREFEPRSVEVADTIAHVFKLIAGDALYRRVPIRHEIAEELPAVLGDRSYLEQVLVILIVNGMDAMKSTPESARELVVTARRNGHNLVEVAVQDCGHGISSEHLSQLFDSFFTTKTDGMGMGLSIARSMIAAHGGRIWAENAAQGGALFRFTLPVFNNARLS